MPKAKPAKAPSIRRIQTNMLATAERRLLSWLCARLPAWVTPDGLTGLALFSAFIIGTAYILSAFDPNWLLLAVFGYVVHWFGDSLDGSVARHRRIERPSYGYFIDHSCDGLATLVILGGIGLSPYLRIDIALFGVAGYLLLSVHTFLMAKVSGDMPLSQAGLGPTEIRIVLIAVTLAMYFTGTASGDVGEFSAFDILFGAAATVMVAIFVIQTLAGGRRLLEVERLRK